MAKKKYDFKPDAAGTSFASKLYLTQKQRLSLLKWTLYALVCLTLLVIQDVMMSGIRVGGASTDLVGCIVILICLLEGQESGGIFALCSSLFYVLSGSAPGAYSILFLTLFGVLSAVFRQAYFRKSFMSTLLCAGLGLLLYEMAVFVMCLVLQLVSARQVGIFLISWLLSMLALPVLYPAARAIGKIGGESWKE